MSITRTALLALLLTALLFSAVACSTKPSPIPKTNLHLPFSATMHWQAEDPSGRQKEMNLELGETPEEKGYRVGAFRVLRMGTTLLLNGIYDTIAGTKGKGHYNLSVNSPDTLTLLFDDFLSLKMLPKSAIRFSTEPQAFDSQRVLFFEGNVIVNVDPRAKAPVFLETPNQKIATRGGLFQIIVSLNGDTTAVFCYDGKVRVKGRYNSTVTLTALERATSTSQVGPIITSRDFPKFQWSYPSLVFDFTEMNLQEAVNQLANWYGMKHIVIDPKIDRKKRGTVLEGRLSRYLTLDQVLDILNREGMYFRKQGQSIVVTKTI